MYLLNFRGDLALENIEGCKKVFCAGLSFFGSVKNKCGVLWSKKFMVE